MKKSARSIISAILGAVILAGSIPMSLSAAEVAITSASPEKQIDNVKVIFDTNPNMALNKAVIQSGSGMYKIIKTDSGDKDAPYVKMLYDNSPSSYSPYRMSIKFSTGHSLTSEYKYARMTYRSGDSLAAQFKFVNTATEGKVTLVENTSVSKGEWVTSAPVNISKHDILARFLKGGAIPLEYTGSWKDADIAIKEIVFFKSVEDAYAYYGETVPDTIDVTSLTFGPLGNGKTYDGQTATGASYGKHSFNEEDGSLDVSYIELTNGGKNIHYMAKVKGKAAFLPENIKFMRLEIMADHPDGVESCKVNIWSDGDYSGSDTVLTDNLVETDKFVLTPTVEVNEVIRQRFLKNGHCSITFDTPTEGGTYKIKALHFFSSKEDADAYTNDIAVTPDHTIKINGNDIKNYKIVVDNDAPTIVINSVKVLNDRINALTGYTLPVITDSEPEGKYEILIGQSCREKSYKYLNTVAPDLDDYLTYAASLEGDTLSITAVTGYAMEDAIDIFLRSFLYVGIEDIPDVIEINEVKNFTALASGFSRYNIFPLYDNIETPTVFTEDFDTHDGYFTEESGEDNWKYEGGKYVAKTSGNSLSYVHVWEADVDASAVMSYKDAAKNGQFGLTLRYADKGAYAKAGYDFEKGVWFIDYREGVDFFRIRAAEVKADIKPGTDYKLNFILDGNDAKLSVDGKEVLNAKINHVTPGQIGVFADGITAYADDYSAALLSGLGTVMKNTVHIKLPDDVYREGGTVVELGDGTLMYQHHSGVSFSSKDNGQTWVKEENVYFPVFGYQQILRLTDGKLMQIGTATVDGVKCIVSFTSDDDGKTWVQGGKLVAQKHPEYGISGGNMNDKLTQSATTGRIFYSVGYEGSATINGNALGVFCEYYYSDDNGATWTRSEDASYDIMGDKVIARFGEHKLLECADGTIRMYCSWHTEGGIYYADSKDGGKTFGDIEKLDLFKSSHASMQFARDPYGPTDTTYYMVWINAETPKGEGVPNRSRLSLAYTEDGKNWEYLGDVIRWETGYRIQNDSVGINHIVDPFITVTEDYIICGTGFGEKRDNTSHQAQRQNIWSIRKDTLPEAKKLMPFTDVTLGAPYYNAVSFAVDNGLFNGTSATTFDPDVTMNRAMFVTVLGRLDKADVSKYTTPTFDDVKAGEWYTSYVEWAAANGIVNGMGGGKYGVTGTITVEQACTILYRYNGGKTAVGDDVLGVPSVSDFTDSASVSAWAADGVKWAIENGIYEGEDGSLNPTAPASRALVATMFANYVRVFG